MFEEYVLVCFRDSDGRGNLFVFSMLECRACVCV